MMMHDANFVFSDLPNKMFSDMKSFLAVEFNNYGLVRV